MWGCLHRAFAAKSIESKLSIKDISVVCADTKKLICNTYLCDKYIFNLKKKSSGEYGGDGGVQILKELSLFFRDG